MTEQQKLWARAWVANNYNGTKACEIAGYAETRWRQTASDNSTNPEIGAYVAKLVAWRNRRLDIDADHVLKRLIEIDELDFGDLMSDDGDLLPIKDWPKAWRTSISAVEFGALVRAKDDPDKMIQLISKLKLPDKLKNLKMLGDHTLVKAWNPDALDEGRSNPPPLNIKFEVAPAKADVQVTNAKPKP